MMNHSKELQAFWFPGQRVYKPLLLTEWERRFSGVISDALIRKLVYSGLVYSEDVSSRDREKSYELTKKGIAILEGGDEN